MDGRESAKCRKSKLRDMISIMLFVNDNRTKLQIVSSPTIEKGQNVKGGECVLQSVKFFILEREREKESTFSLRSRLIRPSDFFGARSKAVLRSEGFAWVPVLRCFDKLREVGVLSYLFYS